jgi:hypothetical protein
MRINLYQEKKRNSEGEKMDWNLVGNILATIPLVGIAGVIVYVVRDSTTAYEPDPGNGN